jgi:hypothetical protein
MFWRLGDGGGTIATARSRLGDDRPSTSNVRSHEHQLHGKERQLQWLLSSLLDLTHPYTVQFYQGLFQGRGCIGG